MLELIKCRCTHVIINRNLLDNRVDNVSYAPIPLFHGTSTVRKKEVSIPRVYRETTWKIFPSSKPGPHNRQVHHERFDSERSMAALERANRRGIHSGHGRHRRDIVSNRIGSRSRSAEVRTLQSSKWPFALRGQGRSEH